MRKKYTPQFQAKVVQEILREGKSISQISSEYGVHTTQLRKWKRQALEGLPDLFTSEHKGKSDKIKKQEAEQAIHLLHPASGQKHINLIGSDFVGAHHISDQRLSTLMIKPSACHP